MRAGEFGARTSYALAVDGETLLVDPLVNGEDERLAAIEIEHVLVAHGRPVVGNGAAALRGALGRGPWQRPKR